VNTFTDDFKLSYATLLTSLWEEMEEILELHCGRARLSDKAAEQLQWRLHSCLQRLTSLQQDSPAGGHRPLPVAEQTMMLRRFATELLGLVESECDDGEWAASCAARMVRAQNRIVDEFQRLARLG
jgi:hypothetical protein